MLSWTHDTILWAALTVSGALWMILHLSLSLRAVTASQLPLWLRILGVLPPLTPAAGYLAGAKLRAVSWCVVALTYLVLRTRV